MRRGQLTLFIIIGLVFVILVAMTLYANDRLQQSGPKTLAPISTQDCEGTKNGQCASERPLQCRNGVLRQDCIDCGCPTNQLCNADGSCSRRTEDVKSNFTVFIVPIGYALTDREFLLRTEIVKTGLFSNIALKDSNIVVVEKTLDETNQDCLTITSLFHDHVQTWLQKQTGKGLPGVRFEGAIPIYPYRIIGIGKNEQDTSRCGCGHTLMYSTNVYLGGAECSLQPHAALHELGHTVGLCDEYDTCTYDTTNDFMRQAFGHPCLNSAPSALNSDCSTKCCSATGRACCNGRYADTKGDGFFNVMGSADVPPERRVNSNTATIIHSYFCTNLGVC